MVFRHHEDCIVLMVSIGCFGVNSNPMSTGRMPEPMSLCARHTCRKLEQPLLVIERHALRLPAGCSSAVL